MLPNDLHDVGRLRISTGACGRSSPTPTSPCRKRGIREYTDPHHAATVPHTVVLDVGLRLDKVYVGFWFWGRPSPYQLWADLQDLLRRTRVDFDPTSAEAKAAWETVAPAT